MREFIENDIDEKSDSRVAIKLFFLRARDRFSSRFFRSLHEITPEERSLIQFRFFTLQSR